MSPPFVDAHLDLACVHLEGSDVCCVPVDATRQCVSLPGLRAAGVSLACATIFTEKGDTAAGKPIGYSPTDDVEGAERAGLRQLHLYHSWEREAELAIVRSRTDLRDSPQLSAPGFAAGSAENVDPVKAGTQRAGDGPDARVRGNDSFARDHADPRQSRGLTDNKAVLRIILLMEGADPIRDPLSVPFWFEHGVRIVGLTWAHGSRYATGNSVGSDNTIGLTSIGRELVRALDRHGIIHDVSHLSDRAFDDLAGIVEGPVIASHSNPRALMNDVQRHIRDDQIAWIASRGGIVGLNLYSKFLAQNRRAVIADCVRAVEHVCAVMGHRKGVGLGSDMDGGFRPADLPVDLDHPSKLGNLLTALRKAGWSAEELEGFAHRNWMRFLHGALAG